MEVGLAVLVKALETDATGEDIIEYCKGKLAGCKRPRKFVFSDQLPRTLTGKILKKDLRATPIEDGRFKTPE